MKINTTVAFGEMFQREVKNVVLKLSLVFQYNDFLQDIK